MKVLLVNPPRFNKIPVLWEDRCEVTERYSVLPPYSLLQIASLLRQKEHDVYLVDANGESIDYSRLSSLYTPTRGGGGKISGMSSGTRMLSSWLRSMCLGL